jgi:phosphate transport system substrate-binding protein
MRIAGACDGRRSIGQRAVGKLRTALVFAVLFSFGCPPPASADTVRIHGSTTFNRVLLEPNQGLIEQKSGHRLVVIPNKSANGIVDLLEGRAELAMISAALAKEIEMLKKIRPELDYTSLREHPITRTRVAFAINPKNGVRKITREQLKSVLSGGIQRWSEVGGADLPISVAFVRSAGGVTHVVNDTVMGGKAISPANPLAVDSPVQVVKIVAQEPGSLGLTQVQLAQQHGLIELDVGPAVEQVLSLVTKGEATPVVNAIIEAARGLSEKHAARRP